MVGISALHPTSLRLGIWCPHCLHYAPNGSPPRRFAHAMRLHSLRIGVLPLVSAWLLIANEVPALSDNSVFNFDSTWLLEENTMDNVAIFTASTGPRGS
jgi:hypothetical protein